MKEQHPLTVTKWKKKIAEEGMLNDSNEMLDQVRLGKWERSGFKGGTSSFEFVELS